MDGLQYGAVDDGLKGLSASPVYVLTPLRSAYAGMQDGQIPDHLEKLLHSVAVLVERPLGSLEIVHVVGAFQVTLVALKPEAAAQQACTNPPLETRSLG